MMVLSVQALFVTYVLHIRTGNWLFHKQQFHGHKYVVVNMIFEKKKLEVSKQGFEVENVRDGRLPYIFVCVC